DPISGDELEVMWVKGSGGDLGTLTVEGLAALDLERVRSLKRVYSSVGDEDRMHELLDRCAFGPPGSAPSIDTSMHALIDARHVDHLHPDSVIALAASVDGEELTKRCFGDEVAWLAWRRPGFELALEIERIRENQPGLKGVVLGGHGLTTWGDTSDECERVSLQLIRQAEEFLVRQGRSDPLGPLRPGFEPLPVEERRSDALVLAPLLRRLASTDRRVTGCWFQDDSVLDFIGREATPRVVPLGTSCPDHFIRTKVRPLLLDLPPSTPMEERVDRLAELHREYREQYREYYERYSDDRTPPMRAADPAVFLIPGVGMFTFGADRQTAQVVGEFYLNAINVIRGAEAVSAYSPISEREKFRVEYWELEEAKLRRRPAPKVLSGKVALVTGAGSGIGRAIAQRFAEAGAVVAVFDMDLASARATAELIGSTDATLVLEADVTNEAAVKAAVDEVVISYGGIDIAVNNAGLSLSASLLETAVVDWDKQYDVMAKGSFLVSKYVAKVMIAQGLGGDIVYIVSKNAVVAGPNNLAYASAKASQAHQVRLLAAELGEYDIRVNGISPDGVVAGSGIFAGGWGADRAEVYGIKEDELGQFYASRTLLQKEVLPEHVAAAALVLVGEELSRTSGFLIPVDGGVASAFPR
ncbi:MAG: bifunctional rhamnulose-1-phosphate aldolase/short-chain dehydrogenase, partial [Actinobacteria bacterium]|nr:bifunctional rhamnulose-1-phosphate aldolase/short-chain dehydrogenase [Actinomycetota bacterium]